MATFGLILAVVVFVAVIYGIKKAIDFYDATTSQLKQKLKDKGIVDQSGHANVTINTGKQLQTDEYYDAMSKGMLSAWNNSSFNVPDNVRKVMHEREKKYAKEHAPEQSQKAQSLEKQSLRRNKID